MSVKLGALRLMVRALEAKERGLRSAEVGVGRVVLGGGRCLGQEKVAKSGWLGSVVIICEALVSAACNSGGMPMRSIGIRGGGALG